MSELASSGHTKGHYEQLSEKVRREADLLNEAFDLHKRTDGIEAEVDAISAQLTEEFKSECEALISEEDVSHDDFLRRYQELLLKLPQRSPEVSEFNVMMEIRSQLAPGVFLKKGDHYPIVTVAAPTDESDGNFGIQPVLIPSQDKPWGRSAVNLVWQVPIEGDESSLCVDWRFSVGKDKILEGLDKTFFSQRTRLSENSYDDIRRGVRHYQSIGEIDKAQRLKGKTAATINKCFDHILRTTDMSYKEKEDLPNQLDTLREFDPASYDAFLEDVKVRMARGYSQEVAQLVLDYIVNEEAVQAETTDEDMSSVQLRIARKTLAFIEEGEVLLKAVPEI